MDKLIEKEKYYCSQGDTSGKHNPKKFFDSAKGCFLYDNNHKKYLDMQMYNSAANFGYQNPAYTKCMTEQLHRLPCLAAEFMHESRVSLSEKICNYMYENYGIKGRVHFTVGGAQAVDDALKLAFNFTKSRGVICFEGGYHGRTMAASSVSSSYRYIRQYGNVIDTYRIPFPNCYSCAYDMKCADENLYCIQRIKRLFESEFLGIYDSNSHENHYSTFLFEPILGRGGYVFPNPHYYTELFKILKAHNIITIADEVQMGFYRTGKMWSFEHFGICPDVIIFGKSISNGLWPLSGIWAKEDIISPEIWPTGSTHCTFSGHPLGTELGLQTFAVIEDSTMLYRMQKSSEKFIQIINKLREDFPFIKRAQVLGHAAGIDLIDPCTNFPATQKTHELIENALNKTCEFEGQRMGLIITSGGLYNSSLMLSPCVFISDEELQLFDKLIRYYLKMTF